MIDFLELFVHILVSPFKTQARLEAEIVAAAASVERVASAHSVEAQTFCGRPIAFRLALSRGPI
jgi:hypothetical protein